MVKMVLIGATFGLVLSGCATTAPVEEPQPVVRAPAGECDATALQDHLGHKASAQSGAVLLEQSGARTLRWAPPRSAITMDFRPDRLTVSYDDDMAITRISCG